MGTIKGLVMCGGKSSRMGTDKGLLLKDGQSWVKMAYDKLNWLGLPVNVSINNTQKESYQPLFEEGILIEDNVNVAGPLAGLLSALKVSGNADLLVLACDMTDISMDTLNDLMIVQIQQKKNDYDFFVYKNGEDLEPLLGIYTNKGLQKIADLLATGSLGKHSMKHVLEIGKTYAIELPSEKQIEFKNYNERKDI